MTQPPWGSPTSRNASWPPAPTWPPPPPQGWTQQQGGTQQGWQQGQWQAAPQQQQPWPPLPQQQPWPPPRPPRRGPSLLGLVFRLALLVVALVFLASLLNSLRSATTERPGTPGQGTQTQAPGTTPYVNEQYSPPPPDMNPPAVPGPRDLAAATTLTRDNPLYAQQVPVPTRCTVAPVDGTTASRSLLESHLNQLMGCLMTVWEGPVTDAGFTMPRPPVVVYSSPVKTACGTFDEVNAAYCSGDQRVYYAQSLLRAFPPAIRQSPYAVEMVVAHEFGHAIQARSAILASEKRLEQRATSEAAANELSRRTEVQADCFAGQFVRSVAQSQQLDAARLDALGTFTYNLGDDVLSGRQGWSEGHGLGTSRQAWFERGLGVGAVSTCNSFTAPAAQVR